MNAIEAVTASSLVYDRGCYPQIADLLKCDSFNAYEDSQLCAIYCRSIDKQYLIFRGTYSEVGWVMNSHYELTQFLEFPGKVHLGFGHLWRSFNLWFKQYYEPEVTLYCAGHSLGGAMATLTAMKYDAEHTYTFGSPRVGDDTFAQAYPGYYSQDGRLLYKRQTRYVHGLDPVPGIPVRGFKHVVDETRIGKSKWGLWKHLTLGFGGVLMSAVEDHRIERYHDALQLLK